MKSVSHNEVIDLCQSIMDFHRTIESVNRVMNDMDEVTPPREQFRNDVMRWGLHLISEAFITDQYQKLNRMIEIYRMLEENFSLKLKRRNPDSRQD